MTPSELNKAIAELVYPDYRCVQHGESDSINLYTFFAHTNDKNNYVKTVNYLNNWSDLMPLVIEHEIQLCNSISRINGENRCVEFRGEYWHDGLSLEYKSAWNTNPQLALAECLLKVLQAKAKEQSDG